MKSALTILNLLFLVSVFTGCQEKLIGIKVYNIDRELKTLFEEWDELGINTVFASPSVFNVQFTALAGKHDIQTFIILPVFYDPDGIILDLFGC